MSAPRFGVGFRTRHFDEIVARPPAVDWFEVIADDHIGVGGPRRAMLERLRGERPVALHGVSLSIAGSAPLREDWVRGLRALADRIEPAWVSDHLCWTALGGAESHDLLPVAHTRAVLAHVAERVDRVQTLLGRRLLLENATAYVAFAADEMDEADFVAELCRRTGCGLLVDLNNLVVNAANLGVDPERYLAAIPPAAVGYLHLAGHAVLPDVRIDTHDADVPAAVWALYASAVHRFPTTDVIIERDDDLPSFAAIAAEAADARARHATALASPAPVVTIRAASDVRSTKDAPSDARSWGAIQSDFWARLVDKPLGHDHAREAGLDRLLCETPVRPARGMRVYSDAYTASLRRALAVNFPALACVLGARDFDRLAAAYLRRHPPSSPDFRSLGTALPDFVRGFRFDADYGVAAGVLAELVALEQAQLEVQDAADDAAADTPDGAPVEPASLGALPSDAWPDLRVRFNDAFRIMRSAHDVLPVIEAVAHGEAPLRPTAAVSTYVVCRPSGRLRVDRIGAEDLAALDALARGATFAQACAAAAPEASDALRARLGARVVVEACARGMVARIEPGSAAPPGS